MGKGTAGLWPVQPCLWQERADAQVRGVWCKVKPREPRGWDRTRRGRQEATAVTLKCSKVRWKGGQEGGLKWN